MSARAQMLFAHEGDFVDIDVAPWVWAATVAVILSLLLFDILVMHRKPHVPKARRAAIETVCWALVGVAFDWWFSPRTARRRVASGSPAT
jgi:hypothetical protein